MDQLRGLLSEVVSYIGHYFLQIVSMFGCLVLAHKIFTGSRESEGVTARRPGKLSYIVHVRMLYVKGSLIKQL